MVLYRPVVCQQCSSEYCTNRNSRCPHCLEVLVMAHRYIYYVMNTNVISDGDYDKLEAQARAVLPDTSPVHGVGSSLADSYTTEQVNKAYFILNLQKE